jgi:hypothetical protein
MSEAKLKKLESELLRMNQMLSKLENEKEDIEKALKYDPSDKNKQDLEDTKQKIQIVKNNLKSTNKTKKKLEEKAKNQKGGKGTRRKHRSGKKWTSSVTRKLSSMSAFVTRRGKKFMI